MSKLRRKRNDWRLGVFTGLAFWTALSEEGLANSATPIALTGWNHDAVFEFREDGEFQSVTGNGFDEFGNSWFEAGLRGNPNGFPVGRKLEAEYEGASVVYELQPYDQLNILRLIEGDEEQDTGVLELVEPGPYQMLYVVAASTFGNSAPYFYRNIGALVLLFADGTRSSPHFYHAFDWWAADDGADVTPVAGLHVANPSLVESDSGIRDVGGVGLFQTAVNLYQLGLHEKTLVGVEFEVSDLVRHTGVFAMSGVVTGSLPLPPRIERAPHGTLFFPDGSEPTLGAIIDSEEEYAVEWRRLEGGGQSIKALSDVVGNEASQRFGPINDNFREERGSGIYQLVAKNEFGIAKSRPFSLSRFGFSRFSSPESFRLRLSFEGLNILPWIPKQLPTDFMIEESNDLKTWREIVRNPEGFVSVPSSDAPERYFRAMPTVVEVKE